MMMEKTKNMLRNATLIILAVDMPLLYYGGWVDASQGVALLGFTILVIVSILIAWAY